jgi:hypothetical protein
LEATKITGKRDEKGVRKNKRLFSSYDPRSSAARRRSLAVQKRILVFFMA